CSRLCTKLCTGDVWPADAVTVRVDEETIRAEPPWPACPRCGTVARPNILMFEDYDWLPARYEEQKGRLVAWLRQAVGKSLAVLEFGAGLAIPTVRHVCETAGGQLIRVNPREADGPPGVISLPLRALEAIRAIEDCLRQG